MSPDPRPRSWWAPSRVHARWAVVGAAALVIALGVTTTLVWMSPQTTPIAGVKRVSAEVQRLVTAQSRADRLQKQVDELQKQIDGKNRKLVSQSGALGHANSQLTQAQQQVASLQQQLSAKAAPPKPVTITRTAPQKPATGPVPITAPTKQQLLAPGAPYFGLDTEQAPFNWGTFDAASLKIGAMPNMVGYFQGWDKGFRADAVTRSWQRGMLPFLTWESRPIADANDVVDAPAYSLPRILAGDFDGYLHQYAHDIAVTGLPVAIRLDQEMNGDWYPWAETDGAGASVNGNGPGQFAAMWRHVHDIFQAEGANEDVIWVWSPNRVDKLSASLRDPAHTASLYPGDDYVDWVGMSGYLRPPYGSGSTYTFDATFSQTLGQLRSIAGKPILLSEVGASEIEGHKAEWVASFFQGLNQPANADIVGFSWFDQTVTSYVEGVRQTNDWRIDSRADSLAAFVAGLTAPGGRFRLEPAS